MGKDFEKTTGDGSVKQSEDVFVSGDASVSVKSAQDTVVEGGELTSSHP